MTESDLIEVVIFDQGDAGALCAVGEPQRFETIAEAIRIAGQSSASGRFMISPQQPYDPASDGFLTRRLP
jgi:hypothetical protein